MEGGRKLIFNLLFSDSILNIGYYIIFDLMLADSYSAIVFDK